MSSQNSKGSDAIRQGVPRMPSYTDAAPRNDSHRPGLPERAQTFHNASSPDHDGPDAFDTSEHSENDDNTETARASIELDVLPIELITFTDSFIESLGAKVHSTPPNIEKLSRLFQEFYGQASSHIATHISALATKQSRDISPSPSISSISSAASRLRSKAASPRAKDKPKTETERQMITSEELASRKKARKALEAKRGTLEEAVERRLCEGIYHKIYRHRTTHDEAQDEKLRSKTAALALVGITPVDLGVDYGEGAARDPEIAAKVTEQMGHSLGKARADLVRMSEARYPLAKTNHLKAAHKSIVDTLAEVHPSASADEIMPMLIYTLITLPPENLHIISDLHFIQYFRWEPKLTGEAAYCLTNLEAAISFLQTVDLSTLREDELPSGPAKSDSYVGTSKTETFPPAYGITAPSQSATEASTDNVTATKPAASPSGLKAAQVLRNRRLSDLVNTPAQALGAASGAVISTADQGLKTISNSLGDSYSFLLGKLRERQESPKESIVVPRTLDDARKLVSTPPLDEDDNASATSSTAGGSEDTEQFKRPSAREDRVLSLIGGRRDTSVDSVRSGHSSTKRVGFLEDSRTSNTPTPGTPTAPAMLESVRNLGSSFNPIGRLSSIGMIRGFGRTTATPSGKDSTEGGDLATPSPEVAAVLPPKQITVPRIPPPNKRFMEIQSPGELRLGEVRELLKDYRRLAGVLKNMGAFDEK
ncbi:VPS9 domain protein [Metarhizium album ARSEF 1941]|uniref:VPS9 domain protein n=1 Tax=Metarhizium album (strain ARSEF 1941) TaxID=1081103 RepID=A0A0B2X2M7_METAS|nr:VPS9 domain protein [Metarhizium album ARSEF 1941]KHN99520.1 VPS9 domain protein [Metarhizium album ARSEF 1941]